MTHVDETFSERALRSLVTLRDPLDLADDAASKLRRAATILKDAHPRRDRKGAMRWRSIGRGSARLHHDKQRDRLLLETSIGLTMKPQVIVQMRFPVLKSGRCSAVDGEIVDLLTCAAVLLEGGAGPVDDRTRTCFSIVRNICSAEPDSIHALPLLHSGNPYEDAYLWDEGPYGRRVMRTSAATAQAMSSLPLITVADLHDEGRTIFVAMHQHCEDYGDGPASPLEVMRLHAELALARG